jgi:hypothetical protein
MLASVTLISYYDALNLYIIGSPIQVLLAVPMAAAADVAI